MMPEVNSSGESGPAVAARAPHEAGAGAVRVDEMCARAIQLQLAGQLAAAEQLYRAALQIEPAHAATHYCLGMLQVQSRQAPLGLSHLAAALEAQPECAEYRLGHLEGLLAADRTEEAAAALARARQAGVTHETLKDYSHRLEARRAEQRRQLAVQRREAALQAREERRLERLIEQRDFAEAFALAGTMTKRFSHSGLAFKVLGAFLSAQGQHDEALGVLEEAVRLLPADAEALDNLGAHLIKVRRPEDAETFLKRALALDPRRASAHFRLALSYESRNLYPEAEASIRAGMALETDEEDEARKGALCWLLFILSHNPAVSAEDLFELHRRTGESFERKFIALWPRHRNSPDPDRPLKIGFLSGDFFDHVVPMFIEPVLAHLRARPDLELHAYYNNCREDTVTGRLRGYFTQFSQVEQLSDERLVEQIGADGIDILIDLSGYSCNHRLQALARKPAPIQVSWVGYPGTTGMRAMDYYLADAHFLTPGKFDRYFTEKLVYLPANVPFQANPAAPEVNALPALQTGYLTFGSFNRQGKINAATLDLWAAVLQAVPDARLEIAAIDGEQQQRKLIEGLQARGIAPERLLFHRRCKSIEYLELHHRIDVCLDTFPYSGGTTTVNALWMGVPTLTLAGSTPASRQGAAIVGPLGLEAFIAENPPDFAARARYWASHLPELAELRAGLRARWQRSPIRQPDLIATSLAAALRHMWTRWCQGLPPESFTAPSGARQATCAGGGASSVAPLAQQENARA